MEVLPAVVLGMIAGFLLKCLCQVTHHLCNKSDYIRELSNYIANDWYHWCPVSKWLGVVFGTCRCSQEMSNSSESFTLKVPSRRPFPQRSKTWDQSSRVQRPLFASFNWFIPRSTKLLYAHILFLSLIKDSNRTGAIPCTAVREPTDWTSFQWPQSWLVFASPLHEVPRS